MSNSFNQKYKEYQKEGGTKSFKEFAEMHNAMQSADNSYSDETTHAFLNQEVGLSSIFEQPTKTVKDVKDSTITESVKPKKVFGLSKGVLMVAGAIILISVGVAVYNKNKK